MKYEKRRFRHLVRIKHFSRCGVTRKPVDFLSVDDEDFTLSAKQVFGAERGGRHSRRIGLYRGLINCVGKTLGHR